MRKVRGGGDGQRRIGAAMVRVTVTAQKVRVAMRDRPMQGCGVHHVYRHVNVTGGTAVRHARRIPGRGVTGTAGRLRVGVNTVESRFAGLGVERAGAEHGTAA